MNKNPFLSNNNLSKPSKSVSFTPVNTSVSSISPIENKSSNTMIYLFMAGIFIFLVIIAYFVFNKGYKEEVTCLSNQTLIGGRCINKVSNCGKFKKPGNLGLNCIEMSSEEKEKVCHER